jgi:hypothetical protein
VRAAAAQRLATRSDPAALVEEVLVGRMRRPLPVEVERTLDALAQARNARSAGGPRVL